MRPSHRTPEDSPRCVRIPLPTLAFTHRATSVTLGSGFRSIKFSVGAIRPDSFLQGDSFKLLEGVQTETVDMVFIDPPYFIKKAEWDTFPCPLACVKKWLNFWTP